MASSSESAARAVKRAHEECEGEKENKKPKLEDCDDSEEGEEAEEGEGSEPESGVDEGDGSHGGLSEQNLSQLGAAFFASPLSTSASFMVDPLNHPPHRVKTQHNSEPTTAGPLDTTPGGRRTAPRRQEPSSSSTIGPNQLGTQRNGHGCCRGGCLQSPATAGDHADVPPVGHPHHAIHYYIGSTNCAGPPAARHEHAHAAVRLWLRVPDAPPASATAADGPSWWRRRDGWWWRYGCNGGDEQGDDQQHERWVGQHQRDTGSVS